MTVNDPVKSQLAPFFEYNGGSEFAREDGHAVVRKPWSDPTLELVIPDDGAEQANLIGALNSVYLPQRLSAIWHRDAKDLELIFTAMPIPPEFSDLSTRSFAFSWDGTEYRCEFRPSSERLLCIGQAFSPSGPPSSTGHRNLVSFTIHNHIKREDPENAIVKTSPTSFWIRRVEWDENRVLELLRHLNFFMHYFDRHCPRAMIHEAPDAGSEAATAQERVRPQFPTVIAARRIDPFLLGLCEASTTTDTFRRFLYSYQTLEYAAFYYLQEDTLQTVRRLLAAPSTLARLDETVRQIVDAVVQHRMEDEAKIVAVVKKLVSPEVLWRQIARDATYFSEDLKFDGGFQLPALLRAGWGLEDFKGAWIPKFPDALRKLRNALVHSREARMAVVIAPTSDNYRKLRRWADLAATTALEVVVYQDV